MTIGIMGSSLRENEFRVPVHPRAISQIPMPILKDIFFEEGYGKRWNIEDGELQEQGAQFASKAQLYNDMDATIIAKPMVDDMWNLRVGGTLIGWLHFTLYGRLASIAVERKQTVLTFEGINPGKDQFDRPINAFPDNSKLAGVGALHHLMSSEGLHPKFGHKAKVCIIGHGNAGSAIVQEALDIGFDDVVCLTGRQPETIHNTIKGCTYLQYRAIDNNERCEVLVKGKTPKPMVDFLKDYDVIFNTASQNPSEPVNYFRIEDISKFDHPCFIVDVSCDPCMGFPFSRTTTFDAPSYFVGKSKIYSVDHIPGFFWDAGSWIYTRGLSPWLNDLLGNVEDWKKHPVLSKAIEIDGGHIKNKNIIDYQSRQTTWPYYTEEAQPWKSRIDINRNSVMKMIQRNVTM